MAEYIDKKKVENITWQEPYYHDPINVLSEVRDKVRELTPADVVERSKYNELVRVNKALQERVTFLESNRPCRDCGSNPIGEYADLENENKYFREKMAKINNAIEKINNISEIDYKDCKEIKREVIEILTKHIGE